MFLRLAFKSLINRKGSVCLTVLAISVSIFVLLAVEHIRHQTKQSFQSTVSGVDLVVGARTGSLNLLLYSVFRIGAPTNNIDWKTYQQVSTNPLVKWTVPISLGDSHKGYRVMGTTQDYFEFFRYGSKRPLTFDQGKQFEGLFDVVLGSEVAKRLNYQLGDKLILAHGIAKTSFSKHDDRPFEVVGVLAPTGTPVDQTLHVSLQGIEAIHVGWQQGVRLPGKSVSEDAIIQMQLVPKSITAFMVGLNSRMATFRVQRDINQFRKEPLTAILPGVALSELWQMMGLLENTLRLISVFVLLAALLGLSSMMLASIRERQQEIHLLRVIGASPSFLFFLVELEAIIVGLLSIALGALSLYLVLFFADELLVSSFGLRLGMNIISMNNMLFMGAVLISIVLAAAIPSFSAYRDAKKNA